MCVTRELKAKRVISGYVIMKNYKASYEERVVSAQQLVVVHARTEVALEHSRGDGVRRVNRQAVTNIRLNKPRSGAIHHDVQACPVGKTRTTSGNAHTAAGLQNRLRDSTYIAPYRRATIPLS